MKTHYETIGVPENATPVEIRKEYLRRITKYHPDRNRHAEAPRIAAQLNEAYQTLSDPQARQTYDRKLLESRRPPPSPAAGFSRPVPVHQSRRPLFLGLAVLSAVLVIGLWMVAWLFGAFEDRSSGYSSAASMPQASEPKRLEASRESPRPLQLATGTQIEESLGARGGGELQVDNQTGVDAVVYLMKANTRSVARSFYLRTGAHYTERGIAAGVYQIAVQTGAAWDPDTEQFQRAAHFSRSAQALEYLDESGGSPPNRYTIRLGADNEWTRER